MDGIINIYKEKGYTSHDVVAKLRGILKQKKIGHTGTLDPEATGVLPVCLGKATKLCDLLTDKDKTYVAVLKLGIETDTQDMTGQILKEHALDWQEAKIREAIASFVGEYEQVPPMYSALKVNGKKLYELAREGKEVERKARRVHIFDIELLSMDKEQKEITMQVHCSKGTYIRTLCADIGECLGCGGCMKSLERIQVERFSLRDSLTLSEVEKLVREETLEKYIIPLEAMFEKYQRLMLKPEADRFLYNGNSFWASNSQKEASWQEGEIVRACDSQGVFKGLYFYQAKEKTFKPYKMFL
ncbi:MAG: tRNA pseudouridine(55) synthase TruB [Acetivibrio ethanolgignens]